MVNRRNFFTISIIMLIVLFLFQFSNYAKDRYNDYAQNSYVQDKNKLPGSDRVVKVTRMGESGQSNQIAYIGDVNADGAGNVVSQWCLYMKKELLTFDSVDAFVSQMLSGGENIPEFVVIGNGRVDWSKKKDPAKLQAIVNAGANIVLCELPEPEEVSGSSDIRQLLGIASVVENHVTVSGLKLYSGLLLGGEVVYQAETEEEQKMQDMNLTFPWYKLSYGTKVYMKGIPEDSSVESEDYPVVIWRKSFENGSIFALNDDYMNSLTGLGLLTGMYCETKSYSLYPVINAQNLVAANFPELADENIVEMRERYSQSLLGVFRDVVWPSVVSIYQNSNMGLSCMLSPQYDYSDGIDPQAGNLEYYLRLINEEHAETGISGYSLSKTPVTEKLNADNAFIQNEVEGYTFSSFYRGNLSDAKLQKALENDLLKDVRTIVEEYDSEKENPKSIVGYETDSITRQKSLVDGFEQTTYGTDFMVRSVETALGYGSIVADMSKVAYPREGEDRWEKMSKTLSTNLDTYWENFDRFDATTVSETDTRIRSFLTTDYRELRVGQVILLDTRGASDDSWFILRAGNEKIASMKGGTYTRLESGAWLIHVKKSHVEITMKDKDPLVYN